jgi:D-3-phosphoglycerate dehydrogenase
VKLSIPDLKATRVLVTPTSYARHDSRLRTELESAVGEVVYNTTGRPLRSEEVREMLEGCDGYIAGLDVIDRAALAGVSKLKVIARYGVGVEKVDLAAAQEKGIVVTNTPGANSSAVAELAVGMMLALARAIPAASAATTSGGWPRLSGIGLEGKTIGLFGLGAIGKLVVRRLTGFECKIIAYDPYPDRAFAEQYGVTLLNSEDVTAAADVISLHLPVLPETANMVNADFLARMKRGALLVNTARGELIDEQALADALASGHLGGAALDAFQHEPPGTANPLMQQPNLIATPHIGAQTDSAVNAMGRMAQRDCLAVLRGEMPLYPVKMEFA